MAAVKVYSAKGVHGYKEKRLIKEIQEAIAQNPNFNESEFKSARNKEELKALHTKYCSTDTAFEDLPGDKTPKKKKPSMEQTEESNNPDNNSQETMADNNTNENPSAEQAEVHDGPDPFNAEEPNVRPYVMEEGMKGDPNADQTKGPTPTEFAEPTNWGDSFNLPGADNANTNTAGNGQKQQQKAKDKKPKEEPLNPYADDQSSSSKKRKTRRFAKTIVKAICALMEKGFIWFGTKEINSNKLAEYEMTNKVDLDVLVTLETGTQATVKQFFQQECRKIKNVATISQEQKDDLTEDLYDLFIEKGLTPTPSQSALMTLGEIFANQGIAVLVSKSQTDSVLAQLKKMKKEESSYEDVTDHPGGGNSNQGPAAQPQADNPGPDNNAPASDAGNVAEEKTDEPGDFSAAVENLSNQKSEIPGGIDDGAAAMEGGQVLLGQ